MFHYDVSVFDFRLEKVSYTILLSSVILSFGFLEFLMEWVLKFFWKSMNRSILYFEVQWQKRTMHGTLGQFYFNIYLKCSILKLEKRLENFHLLLLVISQYLSGHFVTFLNFKMLLLLSGSLEENMKFFLHCKSSICSATLCTSTSWSPIFYVMFSCTICYWEWEDSPFIFQDI